MFRTVDPCHLAPGLVQIPLSFRAAAIEPKGPVHLARRPLLLHEWCNLFDESPWPLRERLARPAPESCAWCCSRSEAPGAIVLPFGTEPGTHAWLHAECWPVWNQAAGCGQGSEGLRGRSWRRERDSNPRYGFPYTRFPSVRLQPLGHPSAIVGRGGRTIVAVHGLTSSAPVRPLVLCADAGIVSLQSISRSRLDQAR